ncbi:hypothetical protein EPUS_04624 [Endocarpon pusillum Z07020]|uniref:Vacuolar protein sorting-associated protein 29 n=1 Tax=Endocarpon pusillum (strain Z07020 / HMAS-L-300199) TaxID=1263415 RepID=U1I189_ENDPU|nr:uncharacterized protein EPUS_04624 [Endocarpon pusillum Z07020]ERF75644.1 hypothetical protein EPUS_04624 [Endocarpon pusillum Z07020]
MASRLVLVIGDLFIPDRAPDIPAKFKKLLTPGKIGQIICLGNLTDRETYEYLRTIAPDLQLVKGDFDTENPYSANTTTTNPSSSAAPASSSATASSSSIPLSKVITHGSLRIGFTHGHTIIPQGDADALLIAARQMDVDVLLWGGTHRFEAGGGRGAYPQFLFDGYVLVLYVYQLRTDANGAENVGVEKVSFRKQNPAAAATTAAAA